MCVRVNTLVLCCLLYVVCVCVFARDTCDLSIVYKIIKIMSGQTSSLAVDMEESKRLICLYQSCVRIVFFMYVVWIQSALTTI